MKRLVKKILVEEESSDTVKVYKKIYEEVPDKPAPKKAGPKKATPKKPKVKKSVAKKVVEKLTKKDEDVK